MCAHSLLSPPLPNKKKERKKENGSAAAASVYLPQNPTACRLLHLFEAKLVFVVRRGEGCVGII
jgi:hypothetical protein